MTDNDQPIEPYHSDGPHAVECGTCGERQHRMSTLGAPAFDYESVCLGCVGFFLEHGRWPESFEERIKGPE